MLLAAARDTAAMAELDARLGRVREEYLRRAVAGSPPGDGFWKPREAAVMAELARDYYSAGVQAAVMPGGGAAGSERAAFDAHGQKLAEQAIRMTHERLKRMPYVGQPEYRDA